MGTGQNCTKTKLDEVTKLHKDKFAPRVNFARLTILHRSKKSKKNIYTYIKKQQKKLLDKFLKKVTD